MKLDNLSPEQQKEWQALQRENDALKEKLRQLEIANAGGATNILPPALNSSVKSRALLPMTNVMAASPAFWCSVLTACSNKNKILVIKLIVQS